MDDPIDALEAGWRAELPDLDTAAMVTVARLNRASILIRRRLEARMAEVEASLAEFDVLSTLRRSGAPYEMNPSVLARATLLSPSGMTHRLDALETAGLIERVVNPTSRRTAPVRLTEAGIEAAERLAREVVDTDREALSAFSKNEAKQLDELLAKLVNSL